MGQQHRGYGPSCSSGSEVQRSPGMFALIRLLFSGSAFSSLVSSVGLGSDPPYAGDRGGLAKALGYEDPKSLGFIEPDKKTKMVNTDATSYINPVTPVGPYNHPSANKADWWNK